VSVERHGGVRRLIAIEAARLMYEEEIKEYFTAKRRAAKRILGQVEGKRARYRPHILPSNGEIRDALLELAESTEGSARTRKLFAMRIVALEVMKRLEPFAPRLIGSVSTGHVRRGSDIDLSLFSDSEESVERHLIAGSFRFSTERTTIFKFGEVREYLHHHVEERFPVELTVYESRELRFRPRSSTDGLPIVRLSISKVEALLERDHSKEWQRYRTDGSIQGLAEAMADLDSAESFDDEPPCIPEPGEEDDPDQLYDPLPGFE
jgi:hypothetical protein